MRNAIVSIVCAMILAALQNIGRGVLFFIIAVYVCFLCVALMLGLRDIALYFLKEFFL